MLKESRFDRLILSAVFATIALTSLTAQNSLAASPRYFCAYRGGVPHTFVRNPRGKIPMIKWEAAGVWSAKDRCIIVSKRFQAFSDNGTLQYLGTGIVNRQSAICAVVNKGDRCNTDNLLITLTATDRHEAARRLLDIGSLAANGPVKIRGEEVNLESTINGESYFDISAFEDIQSVVPEEEIIPIEY
jgi:Circadian oscillating protein COP23